MDGSHLPVPMDPLNIYGGSNLHFGIVRCVDDPEMRGRVLVECPSVYGSDDPENWTTWAEFCGNSISSTEKDGDMGIWWPATPGQLVLLGFEGGNPEKPYCIPGGAWGDEGKPQVPKEIASLKKKCTNARCIKSPAGHTLMFDDNGESEAMYLCDWTGAGFFSMAPGKKADEASSSPCTQSKMRKGETRGDKTVFAQTSKKAGDLLKQGESAVVGIMDINGQGIMQVSQDGDGNVWIVSGTAAGDPGTNIVLDAKNNRIILTAGKTQLMVDGAAGHVYSTSTIIWEMPFTDVFQSLKGLLNKVKDRFKKFSADGGGTSV